jgi:membrane-associated phospholipid phosphatase
MDGPGRVPAEVHPVVPTVLRRPLAVTATLVALAVAILAVLVSGSPVGLPLDVALHAAVAGEWGEPGPLALLVDSGGDPRAVALIVVLVAAVCLVLGRRRHAVLAVVAPVLTGLLTTGLKPVVGRTIHGDNLSYPSGHTASTVAIALVVALLLVDTVGAGPIAAVLLIASLPVTAGATMAITQVVLDAHYPTDTVGGFGTAFAAVITAALVIDRVGDRRRRSATE